MKSMRRGLAGSRRKAADESAAYVLQSLPASNADEPLGAASESTHAVMPGFAQGRL